jgi:hypothetical protein
MTKEHQPRTRRRCARHERSAVSRRGSLPSRASAATSHPRPAQQSLRSLTCACGRRTAWQSPRGSASVNGHDGEHNPREKDPREDGRSTSHDAQVDAQHVEHRATRRALRRLSRPKRVLHDRDGNEEQNLKDRETRRAPCSSRRTGCLTRRSRPGSSTCPDRTCCTRGSRERTSSCSGPHGARPVMLDKASGIASFMHCWTMHQSRCVEQCRVAGCMRAPRAPLHGPRHPTPAVPIQRACHTRLCDFQAFQHRLGHHDENGRAISEMIAGPAIATIAATRRGGGANNGAGRK